MTMLAGTRIGAYEVIEALGAGGMAKRIAQGPIPIDEALPIAHQIIDVLEAAHDPKQRVHDIGDVRLALRGAFFAAPGRVVDVSPDGRGFS